MNCQECRSLVERFLDHALTGFTKRKVNLHLSRCADCRAYFDRRRQNQALAYRALNAALVGTHLPEGFSGKPVKAPFPEIAVHVVEPPAVRCIGAYDGRAVGRADAG